LFLWQFTGGANQCGLLVFGVFSEHALSILNFSRFDEGYYPFCSGVIYELRQIGNYFELPRHKGAN